MMDSTTEDKPQPALAERDTEEMNIDSKDEKNESNKDEIEDGSKDESKIEGKDDSKSEVKLTYKSFKKKYRKMRVKFDDVMRESNLLYEKEQQGLATAKRLARENDQILEMLLDMNDSHQMPIEKRFDLGIHTPTPSLSSIPSLISSEERGWAQNPTTNSAADLINQETLAKVDAIAAEKAVSIPPKSFQKLLDSTPHITSETSPQDFLAELQPLEGCNAPIAYLTVEQIDEHAYSVDVQLGIAPPQSIPVTSAISHRNPHSVYNWLRQHEPKVFLQDGEGSEKSQGKPGSLRGAGKRASMPYPSKPDALEIVEEDGLGYDPTIAGLEPATKGNKRKREDDGGYHPKLGAPDGKSNKKPRARKRKTDGPADLASTPNPPSSRKGKGKGKNSSPNHAAEGIDATPSAVKSVAGEVKEEDISRSSSPELPKDKPSASA